MAARSKRVTDGVVAGRSAASAAVRAAELDELVSALLTASRALVGVSARSIAKIEDTLTLTQFRTLVVLDSHGEVTLNRLADDLAVNASTALRSVDRLLASALVTRRENPTDRREVLLGVTPAGARVVRQVTARRRRDIARIVGQMRPTDRSVLIDALRGFADAAGELPAEVGTVVQAW